MTSVANAAPAGACVGPSGANPGAFTGADDEGAVRRARHGAQAPCANDGPPRGVGHPQPSGSPRGPIPSPRDPGGEAPRGASGAAAAPGLVSSKTSVTLERNPTRIKRMQKTVRESSRLHQEEVAASGLRFWAVFLTFTYAPDATWEPGHMTAYVRAVRAYLGRLGLACRYVWVMELHKSGRPHYHAVFWLPRGQRLPKPDQVGWWPYGSTKIELARSPVGYLAKYASKGVPEMGADDHRPAIPKGARLSGNGGLSKAARMVRSWRLCPAWVREIFSVEDRPIRAPGGGWLSRLTGDFEPSRWAIVDRAPDWSWIRFEPVEVSA